MADDEAPASPGDETGPTPGHAEAGDTAGAAPGGEATAAFEPPTAPAPLTGAAPPVGPAPPSGPPPVAPTGRRSAPVVLALLLAVSLVGNVFAYLRWSDARDDNDTLAEKVSDLRGEVKDLRDKLARAGEGGVLGDGGGEDLGGLEDLLGGLLGGEGGEGDLGGLEDLLGGLLGGEGGEDLGGLEDLLGGLLGGEGDLGGLDLGTMMGCLGGGDLSGLLGGGDGGGGIPDDDAGAQYDAVAAWVEEERGLEFEEVPEPTYVDAQEMTRRVQADIAETYPREDAALDSDLYAALGVIEPGTDVLDLYTDFMGQSVAGYYDPETGELVVQADNPSAPLDGYALVALAHELEHALADQRLDIPDDDVPPGASDEWQAQLALIEGDATLTMTRFQTEALDPTDMMGMFDSSAQADAQAALDAAPHFFGAQLMFPYNDGLAFACSLGGGDSWEAIDEAYADPPTTTAQILFPERYTEGEGAVDPPDPTAPSGWTEARTRTFGAAELMWLFEAPGDDPSAALADARAAVEAWAGGEARQWSRGDDAAVGLSFVERDGSEGLCEPIQVWYRAAFPGDSHDEQNGTLVSEGEERAGVVTCDGANVRIGLAPDLDTARQIAGGPSV